MGLFTRSNASADAKQPSTSAAQVSLPKCKFNTHLESNVACLAMDVEVDARADVMYTLLADPTKHAAIFDAIEGASCKLIEECGPKRKYELDYMARWKFWRVSGLCENRLYMETDADQGTVSFKLREPGFLRVYEGVWRITPAGQPALNLHSGSLQQRTTNLSSTTNTTTPAPTAASSQGGLGAFMSNTLNSLAANPFFNRAPSTSGHTSHTPESSYPVSVVSEAPTPLTVSPPSTPCPSSPRLPWSGLFSGLGGTVLHTNLSGPGLAGLLASINNPLQPHPSMRNSHGHSGALSAASPAPSICDQADTLSDCDQDSHHHHHHSASGGKGSIVAPVVAMPPRARVQVEGMRMSPKVSPPSMLAGLLKGHAVTQVEDMLRGLLAAAQQLQAEMPDPSATVSPCASRSLSPSPSFNSLPATTSVQSTRSSTPLPGEEEVAVVASISTTPFKKGAIKTGAAPRCSSHRISFSVSDDDE